MLNRITHYFAVGRSLLRVPTYLLLLTYLFAGFFEGLFLAEGPAAHGYLYNIGSLVVCSLTIALWYINGTGLNDYADFKIDLINLKGDRDRPLITRKTNRKELLGIVSVAGILAIILAALLSWSHTILVLILIGLNITYSIKPFQISRRGGLAPILLPMGYVVLPFCFGFMLNSNGWSSQASILLIAFYLQFLGRIILKDYRDVKGDKMHGKMTFLLRHGNSTVCAVSAGSILFSAGLFIMFFYSELGLLKYGVICLTFYAVTILLRLSKEQQWKNQKPLLAAFGRAMTGVTAAVIASLAMNLWHIPVSQSLFIALIITGVYLWSATNAFDYNNDKLSNKR